jgi:hypothetical protein
LISGIGFGRSLAAIRKAMGIMGVSTTVSDWIEAPATLDGQVELAIGDVHGCRDQLKILKETMAGEVPAGNCQTFLGDLVDQGPKAAAASGLPSVRRRLSVSRRPTRSREITRP